jgi:hypothetical protein
MLRLLCCLKLGDQIVKTLQGNGEIAISPLKLKFHLRGCSDQTPIQPLTKGF